MDFINNLNDSGAGHPVKFDIRLSGDIAAFREGIECRKLSVRRCT
jgi:hypothetical protein